MSSQRRPYRLGKRANRAAETRRRIVEATLSLHDEQGISGTSVRDVARRAGVSPATVLSHFPSMGELVQACGQLTSELLPFPDPGVFDGCTGRFDAVRRAAGAIFEFWERAGSDVAWHHLQVDRTRIPEVDAWLDDLDRARRELLRVALGTEAEPRALTLAVALTSRGSWSHLAADGLSSTRAATLVAESLIPIAELGSASLSRSSGVH